MAYSRRGSGLPRSKSGHTAHTRMGLPKGNPMAGGGNFRKGSSTGRRRGAAVRTGRRRGY